MDSNSAIQNPTSRERLLRIIRGEKVDRVPVMPFDTFEASKLIEGSKDLVFATGIKLEDFTNGWKRRGFHHFLSIANRTRHPCQCLSLQRNIP